MKKILACIGTLTLCLGALQAAPVLGPPVGQCSAASGVTGVPNDLIVPFATWSAANFACEQQDKIYSNFAPGAIPTDATLRLQVQPLGTADFHTVSFQGNFLASFTVSYDIAIDMTVAPSPLERILAVSADISNPSNTGTPNNVKTLSADGGGAVSGSIMSLPGNPGTPVLTNVTSMHVQDAYTANGGAVVSISNTFLESNVPEPVTYAMIGSGLLLLASLRRFRRI